MQIKPLQKKTKVKRQAKSIKAKKVNSNLFNIGTMLGFNKSLLKIQLDKDIAKAILYRNSIDEEIMTRRLTGSTGNYIRIGDDHNIFFPYENDGFKIQYLTSQQTRKYNIQQQAVNRVIHTVNKKMKGVHDLLRLINTYSVKEK